MKIKSPVSQNITTLHKTNQQNELEYRNVDPLKSMFVYALST